MKQILRSTLKQERDKLDLHSRTQFSTTIASSIQQLAAYVQAEIVGLYYPINSEANPLTLTQDNKTFCLPDILEDRLIFYQWDGKTNSLNKGLYSPTPKVHKLIKPELLIIPMLGFDREGNRLGYGRGFYDKYLQHHPNIKARVGIAFSCQECQNLPHQPHDQKMNFIISEKEVIKIG